MSRVHTTPMPGRAALAFALAAASVFTAVGPAAAAPTSSANATSAALETALVPLEPFRLADTRLAGDTVDGLFEADGRLDPGQEYEVDIAGRGGVPADASGAVVNVTAISPQGKGFLTVHPCESPRPLASSLNYTTGVSLGNEVVTKLSASGTVCVYTSAGTHLAIDVVGSVPAAAGIVPLDPARLLDTRAEAVTIDGQFAGDGRTVAESMTTLTVAGRGGVPADADAVIIDVIAVQPSETGYVTVHPCLPPNPLASSLNHVAGVDRANEIVSALDDSGDICIYTDASIDLVVDVVAYVPAGTSLMTVAPTRLLETRAGLVTSDGLHEGVGRRAADSEYTLAVAERAEVPADALAAILNVTAVRPESTGFITVHPCVSPRPLAASLNHVAGVNGGNEIIASLDANGDVCLYNSVATDLVVDVTGFVVATADLAITASADVEPAAAGENLTYTLDVENNGPLTAVDVAVESTLPAGVTFVATSGCAEDPAGSTTCSLGDIDPGGTAQFTLEVSVDLGVSGSITFDAEVSSATADPGEALNTASVTSTVVEVGVIEIVTATAPAGGTGFGFTDDIEAPNAFTLDDGATQTFARVPVGTYTVTEDDPTPTFDLTALTCIDSDATGTASSGDTGTRTATIVLDPNETVTCTYTNTERGTIIVEMQTLPDGDAETFDFSGDVAGTIGDGETIELVGVLPGTYTTTEAAVAGWDLTGIECDDVDSSADLGTATATFEVQAGETVTCTFTNTKHGSITINAASDPSGGTGFTFTDDIEAPNTFTLDDGQSETFTDVAPGTYTVAEDDPTPAFDLTGLTCSDSDASGSDSTTVLATRTATINLDPGESVSCDFTNTDRGSITVVQQTLPDGDSQTFGFTGDAAGSIADNGTIVEANLIPGTYTSTQSALAGWDLTSLTCDDGDSTGVTATGVATFVVGPGEDVTCTFTNTKRGTIAISKVSDPTGGAGFAFTDTVPGSGSFTLDDGQTETLTNVVPGTYTVTETDPAPGADLTVLTCNDSDGSGTDSTGVVATRIATINLDPGETVACTFSNTERGTITIIADTVPDDPQDITFTGTLGAFSLDDDADGTLSNTATFTQQIPGTFTVTQGDPSPANFGGISCSDGASATPSTSAGQTATINLDPGESVTCTFTNSFNTAPVITAPGANVNVAENQTAAADVQTTDDNDSEASGLTYSFTTTSGGADNGSFSLNGSTGVVTFDAAPNFEAAGDDDGDNLYEVEVTVTDSGPGTPLTDVVVFTVTVTDANESPVAVDDAYTVPVNVLLDAGTATAGTDVDDADGVLTKGTDDSDPDAAATLTVTAVGATPVPSGGSASATTSGGGTVTMNSDGTFTYVSEVGESAATDTFAYTLSDGALTDTATVTITLGDTIWFVDNSITGGANDGRSSSPFETVGAFNTATTGTGDTVFVHAGTLNDDGFDLGTDQILVGEASGLSSGGLVIPAGAAPVLAPASGNAINLDSDNTIRGLDVGDTPGGHALSGGAVGVVDVSNVDVTGTGGIIRVTTSGDLDDVVFGAQSSTGSIAGNAAIDLNGIVSSGGQYAGGSPTITASNGAGISVQNSSATIAFTDPVINGGGGDGVALTNNSGSFTTTGGSIGATNPPGGNAVDIAGGSGTVTIASSITNVSQRAVEVTGRTGGAVTLSGAISDTGTGLRISGNSAGSTTLSGASKVFNTGNYAGVTLTNNTGHTVDFTGGGLDIDTGLATGFTASGGGTVTVQGAGNTVASTLDTAIDIANTEIGASDVTFQSVSSNGGITGIRLSNTGASGGLTITGTGTIAGSGGTIQGTSQHGIQVTSATQIDLNNLELTNVATDNGSGTSVFGGDIAGYVAGVKLQSVSDVSLTNVDIIGNETGAENGNLGQVGISGKSVSGLSISDTIVENFGNAGGEDNIQFQGLTGTVTVNNLRSRDSGGDLFAIDNTGSGGTAAGGNLTLTVDGSTFDETVNGVGAGGLRLSVSGAGTTAVSVASSTFGNGTASGADGGLQGTGLQLNVGRGHTGTLTVEDSSFTGMNVAISGTLDIIGGGAGPILDVDIRDGADADGVGNTIHTIRSNALNFFTNGNLTSNAGELSATVTDNVIGTLGTTGSGSEFGSGISFRNEGASDATLLVADNTIQEMGPLAFEGIYVVDSVAGGTTNVTITDNTMREFDFDRAIQVANTSNAPAGTTCANISGNTFSGTIRGDTPFNSFTSVIRVRQVLGTFNVVQAAPTPGFAPTELDDANGLVDSNITVTGTITFNSAACVLP